MKYYAQFYRESVHATDQSVKYTQILGSHGIINIDGRCSSLNIHAIAADECHKRRGAAYQILRGPCLREAKEAGSFIILGDDKTSLETISARINRQ